MCLVKTMATFSVPCGRGKVLLSVCGFCGKPGTCVLAMRMQGWDPARCAGRWPNGDVVQVQYDVCQRRKTVQYNNAQQTGCGA